MKEPSKLIIEVTVTEVVNRKDFPDTPYSPEEIAEQSLRCIEAGASVLHLHARDRVTGDQRFQDVDLYAEAMHLIMKDSDAICYPTWPPRNDQIGGIDRFTHVFALAKDPTVGLQFMDVDTGVMLRGKYDPVAKQILDPDRMYLNTHGDTIAFLERCKDIGLKPRFGMRELGHVRHLLTFMEMGLLEEPLMIKFGLNDDILFNLAPEPRTLMAFLDWLPDTLQYEWFTQSQGQSHHIVNNSAILLGGHIRTGIGDNLDYAGKRMGNVDQVRKVVQTAHAMDREVATPNEAREILGLASLQHVRAKAGGTASRESASARRP